jgi:hypothetical protein
MSLKSLLRRYPLASYFALAFGIAWVGSLLTAIVAGRACGTWRHA